jgi:hypothetical protein
VAELPQKEAHCDIIGTYPFPATAGALFVFGVILRGIPVWLVALMTALIIGSIVIPMHIILWWRCPRCMRPFFMRDALGPWWFWRVNCARCQLPLYAPHDEVDY